MADTAGRIIDRVLLDTSEYETSARRLGELRRQLTGQTGSGGNAAATVTAAAKTEVAAQKEVAAAAKASGGEQLIASQKVRQESQARVRDFRAEAAQVRKDIGDASSLTGFGKNLVDNLIGTDRDMIRVRTLTTEFGQLERAQNQLTAAGLAGSDQFAANAARMSQVGAELTGLGAKYSGTAGLMRSFVSETLQMGVAMAAAIPSILAIQAALAVVGAVASTASAGVNSLINPMERSQKALRALGDEAKGAASAFEYLVSRGMNPTAEAIDLINRASDSSSFQDWAKTLIGMSTAAGAASAGFSGVSAEIKEFALALGGPSGAGIQLNPFESLALSFNNAMRMIGGADLVQERKDRLAAFFEQVGAAGEAEFNRIVNATGNYDAAIRAAIQAARDAGAVMVTEGERIANAWNKLNDVDPTTGISKLQGMKIDWGIQDQQTELNRFFADAQSGLTKLASGQPLFAAERTALQGVNAELVVRAAVAGAAVRQERNYLDMLQKERAELQYRQQLADIDKQIAVIQGKKVGGAQDLITAYNKQMGGLDAQLKNLDEQQKKLERARALAQDTANIRRAGVAQAGDNGFDVAANIAEAKAQASRNSQNYAMDDARAKIQGERDALQAKLDAAQKALQIEELMGQRSDIIEEHRYQAKVAAARKGLEAAEAASAEETAALMRGLEDQRTGLQREFDVRAQLAREAGIDMSSSQIDGMVKSWKENIPQFQKVVADTASYGLDVTVSPKSDNGKTSGEGGHGKPGTGIAHLAAGGSFLLTEPTYFPQFNALAGEAGPERVTFTPLAGGPQPDEETRSRSSLSQFAMPRALAPITRPAFTPVSNQTAASGGGITIVLSAAPVILDGRTIGQIAERQVNIEAAKRVRHGIA